MSLPAFIDLEENEQVAEIRDFLRSKGADISEESSVEGFERDLTILIEGSDICWNEVTNETELETLFNGIISLVLVVPPERSDHLIYNLCSRLAKCQSDDKTSNLRFTLLSHLFYGVPASSPVRYSVFMSMIQVAGQFDLIHQLNTDFDEIKIWVKQWDLNTVKFQALLRKLHEAFLECKEGEKASKAMLELLGSYTEENASQARDDAHRCIVTSLTDPNTFLMDHLLALKPVKFLEGELIHDLLTIFVSGKLSQYMDFYNYNKDYIGSIGLSHDENMRKMRVLTFMMMAEGRVEIDFDTIQRDLMLAEDDLEAFIIDIVRTKTVRARIDQMGRRVIVSSTTHRTFSKQQWQLLREKLGDWQSSLGTILGTLQTVQNVAPH